MATTNIPPIHNTIQIKIHIIKINNKTGITENEISIEHNIKIIKILSVNN